MERSYTLGALLRALGHEVGFLTPLDDAGGLFPMIKTPARVAGD